MPGVTPGTPGTPNTQSAKSDSLIADINARADPGFDGPETEPFDERSLQGFEGYTAFLNAMATETAAYDGQVVQVHGDMHFFKIGKPLNGQAYLLHNFERVQTFCSPNVH